jgi:glycosyltransferase involved in cell wall biosynthesis
MKKNVLLRAPLLSYSGYGTHARQIFRWLLSRDDVNVSTNIVPWGITPWMINGDFEGGLINEIMMRSGPPSDQKSDVTLQLQLPNEWDPNLGHANIGISACVETDKCNPAWIDCCNKMDAIVVPSEHTKKTLQNSGDVLVPLSVVPESYYDALRDDQGPDTGLDFCTNFNFLLFGQFTGNNPENDRKNLFYSIKWLCEVFKSDPDVGIVIKTNSGTNSTIDRLVTTKLLRQLLSEVRDGPYPKFHFLHGAFTSAEIGSIYRHPKIKALVSFTRGEGFGLPLLEAAVCGLPVIATDWSAHTEFLNRGKFLGVDYTLEEVHGSRIDNQIFMPGTKWARPSEESAKQRLRKFRKASHLPQKWAASLKEMLVAEYAQENIQKIYDEKLGGFFA